MSNNASEMFRTQYADRAMAIYQQRGSRLRGAVTTTDAFNGSSEAKFYLAGKSVGYETTHAGQTNTPSGQGITPFTVPLRTWTVYEHIYKFDEQRLSINEKEIIYDAGAMAMGRITDKVIFDEMYTKVEVVNGGTGVTTGCDFSAAAFGGAAATTMMRALQSQIKRWDGEVYCALPEQAWNELLLAKVVNSADHVPPERLPFAQVTDSRFWNGVNWFLYVEENAQDMYHVIDGTDQDILMWHKSAIAWAPHSELTLSTQWQNWNDTLSVNMKLLGASTTLQAGNGIVRARVRGTSALAVHDT